MRVLLVDVTRPLLDALRTRLAGRHEVSVAGDDLLDPDQAHARTHDVVVQGLPTPSSTSAAILRASLGTWHLTGSLRPGGRHILLSSMRQLAGYDPGWAVDESFTPRPDAEELSSHLAELLTREQSRRLDLTTWVLRLDTVVEPARFARGPVQPDWVHLDDAVAAIAGAVEAEPGRGWRIVHVVRGDGARPLGPGSDLLGWRPRHRHPSPAAGPPRWPQQPAPITGLPAAERLTLYGSGGPLGATAVQALLGRRMLRVTDAAPIAVTATRPAQSRGAPLPRPVPAPHQDLVVDVTDPDAVREAAVDADCLINLAVVRDHPVQAFRVNTLGALHVVRAALTEGVPRIVHTGPTLTVGEFPYGFGHDREVTAQAPYRPGSWIYANAKMLGQEIVRIMAEQYRLPAPILLFCQFFTPGASEPAHPFSLSWPDTGRLIAHASTIADLPGPAPVINGIAPAPHGIWSPDTMLGFTVTDRAETSWWR